MRGIRQRTAAFRVMNQPHPRDHLVNRALQALRKEYVLVGKTHVKAWRLWLALAGVLGGIIAVFLVAGPGGKFLGTRAATLYPPASLAANAVSPSQINLSWVDTNSSEAGYSIERSRYKTSGYKIIANVGVNTTFYSDTSGLSASTAYYYRVRAYEYGSWGTMKYSWYSNVASATTLAAGGRDTMAPSVPSNVTASALSPTQVVLSWNASTDNVGVAGYRVYRSGMQIATFAGTSYTDSGLTVGTVYSYTVSAYDFAGNVSAQSVPVSFVFPPSLSVSPSSFTAGTAMTVRVTNAAPNATVRIFSKGPDGVIVEDTPGTTDASGAFSRVYDTASWAANTLQGWVTVNGVQSNTVNFTVFTSVLPIGATATYKGNGKIWIASRINQDTILFARWSDPLNATNIIWRSASRQGSISSESSSEIAYRSVVFYENGTPADVFGQQEGPYDIWLTPKTLYMAQNGSPRSWAGDRIGYGTVFPAWYTRQWCGVGTICKKFFAQDLWDGWPYFGFVLQKEGGTDIALIFSSAFYSAGSAETPTNFELMQGIVDENGSTRFIRGTSPATCSSWATTLGFCKNAVLQNGTQANIKIDGEYAPWWTSADNDLTANCSEFGVWGAVYPSLPVMPHGVAVKISGRDAPTRAESAWPASSEGACEAIASADFSSIQGKNYWWYLASSGAQMVYDFVKGAWQGNETYLLVWPDGGHPGVYADAVRRWIAPASGTVRITGTARDEDPNCGDGVFVVIRRGLESLWKQNISNGNTAGYAFELNTSISRDGMLDFVINKGSQTDWCDGTVFNPTIVFRPS